MASRNKPLITMIIPVYNVEKFLSRCLDSVLKQSYDNLEIIVVNDGSTDSSKEIIDSYKNKDSRVVVINKRNGGLSSARNEGIKNAHGDYVCFVDSDDYVSVDFVESLFNSIRDNNTKISQCDIDLVDLDSKTIDKWKADEGYCVIEGRQLVIDSLRGNNTQNIVVWNRMYAKELLNVNSFEENRIHEDEFFTYKLLYEHNISIVHKCMYKYVQNPHGITKGRKYGDSYRDIIDAYNGKVSYFIDNKDHDILGLLCTYIIRVIPSILKKYYVSSHTSKTCLIKQLRQEYNHIKSIAKKNGISISILRLIKTKLALWFPTIYVLCKRNYERDGKNS